MGRIKRGALRENMPVSLVKRDGTIVKSRIKELFSFEGLGKLKVTHVGCGDICALTGIEGFGSSSKDYADAQENAVNQPAPKSVEGKELPPQSVHVSNFCSRKSSSRVHSNR